MPRPGGTQLLSHVSDRPPNAEHNGRPGPAGAFASPARAGDRVPAAGSPALINADGKGPAYRTQSDWENDEIDQGRLTYRYTTDPEASEDERQDFDVRDLGHWPIYDRHPPFANDARGRLMGFDDPTEWQASDAYKELKARWVAWRDTGELEAIRQTIRAGIEHGEIHAAVPAHA